MSPLPTNRAVRDLKHLDYGWLRYIGHVTIYQIEKTLLNQLMAMESKAWTGKPYTRFPRFAGTKHLHTANIASCLSNVPSRNKGLTTVQHVYVKYSLNSWSLGWFAVNISLVWFNRSKIAHELWIKKIIPCHQIGSSIGTPMVKYQSFPFIDINFIRPKKQPSFNRRQVLFQLHRTIPGHDL